MEARFMDKVSPEPNSGCWLWTAACDKDGYGLFKADRLQGAHRYAFELFKGEIPKGLQIDHLCKVRCCVNPDHLEAVTFQENMRRGANAQKLHCIHGHIYDERNTLRLADGSRQCRMCRRGRVRKFRSTLKVG